MYRDKGKKIFRTALMGILGVLCAWTFAGEGLAYSDAFLCNKVFSNMNRNSLKYLKHFEAGTAVAVAGKKRDVERMGEAEAVFESKTGSMYARSNVQTGEMALYSGNKGRWYASSSAGAAIVDTYEIVSLPDSVKLEDVVLKVTLHGLLNNKGTKFTLGVVGDKGTSLKIFKGPADMGSQSFEVGLTQLIGFEKSFTLGIAGQLTAKGRAAVADLRRTLTLTFLADGKPIHVTSEGGYNSSQIPLPNSLLLFGSAIVGLVSLRSRMKR